MGKRPLFQLLMTILYNSNFQGFLHGTIYRGKSKAACVPGLNCYSCPGAIGACPLGALQSFFSGVVLRIPFYVAGILLFFAVALGRFICGWLCPFGFFQEILFRIPVKKVGKSSVTQALCYVKYVVALLFVILLPIIFFVSSGIGEPVFCEYICPVGTGEAALPLFLTNPALFSAAGWLTIWKFVVLIAIIVAAIIVYRPFCRFLCPLGAFYGFFNRFAFLGIAVREGDCTHCGSCRDICPMDIRIAGDKECISCGRCIAYCPEKAIYYRNPFTCSHSEEVVKK